MASTAISTRKFVRTILLATILPGCYKTITDRCRLLIHTDGEPLYICPCTGRGCNLKFKTLVDVIQHLESRTCGASRRADVARLVRYFFTDTGPIRS